MSSSRKAELKANSLAYWSKRFEGDWEEKGGREQSRFFSRLALDGLPAWFHRAILSERLSICDWGCALGDGTDLLAQVLGVPVTGVDFSPVAIAKALHRYRKATFLAADFLGEGPSGSYDILFTSNTLEHFSEPWVVLEKISACAREALVVLVPFEEYERIEEHEYAFDERNIPLVIASRFHLAHSAVLDASASSPTYWPGRQILLIYVTQALSDRHRLTLADVRIGQDAALAAQSDEIRVLNAALARSRQDADVKLEAALQAQRAEATMSAEKLVDAERRLGERDRQHLEAALQAQRTEAAMSAERLVQAQDRLSQRDRQLKAMQGRFAASEAEIAELRDALALRAEAEAMVLASMARELAARDEKIEADRLALGHAIRDRQALEAEAGSTIAAFRSSTSWRITAPLRAVGTLAKRLGAIRKPAQVSPAAAALAPAGAEVGKAKSFKRGAAHLFDRYRRGLRRHGLLLSIGHSVRVLWELGSMWLGKRLRHREYEARLRQLFQIIARHQGFVDLMHIPMGWNTALFQRFQHMSIQAARLGGLALYGGHNAVDKDILVFRTTPQNVVVFDALDERVMRCVYDALCASTCKKILRLQSIDLATTEENVQWFLANGFSMVYEYIDAISEEITGAVPGFVRERHRAILRDERILVVCTADALLSEVRATRSRNYLLSTNGVDAQHWRVRPSKAPYELAHILRSGRIVVAYHGALAKWIDYELLRKIADVGDYEVVLIGHDHDSSFASSALSHHEHVHYLGSRSYFDLGKYAAFYDIAIVPFKISALTQSVSPVKLFEYMAAGKPIVSTPLPECEKYASCLIATSHESFLAQLRAAVAARDDATYLATLARDAEQNSWTNKAIEVFRLAGADVSAVAGHAADVPSSAPASGRRLLDWTETASTLATTARNTLSDIGAAVRSAPPATSDVRLLQSYATQILSVPDKPGADYVALAESSYVRQADDAKVIAYYLPQFHPTPENDEWWGRGTTEWNNVSRAVAQYVGHYQPRLPGELGYYDLRIKDVLQRQIELASMYGIHGFAFYYYWFDGRRLLSKPLDMFLANKELQFPFCLCWANESWTRRFDGTSGAVLVEQSASPESYASFIDSVLPYLRDDRYMRCGDRPVLIVYRPSFVPESERILEIWRKRCRAAGVGDPYIIGVKEHTWDVNLLAHGFDAQSEFHPGTMFRHCSDITADIKYVRRNFSGLVLDYRDIVEQQKYFRYTHPKLYRAVMPMWDNTPRRNDGGMIFEGSTPQLYGRWLRDVLVETRRNTALEEPYVFINAWNEWGEGAYLEPDRRYGYAYLQATRNAIEAVRA